MKRLFITILLWFGALSIGSAQTDYDRREAKIAAIVMLLPVGDSERFNRLMGELMDQGDVIGDLAPRLDDSGTGKDVQWRYAISGLAMYASQGAVHKESVAKSLCQVIEKVSSDEVRDFLLIQLQYVAGEESVETASKYLSNNRLADAAARVLVRIGSDAAGNALLYGLHNASMERKITLVQALGEMSYLPAVDAINGLITLGDMRLRKVMLYSLAKIASPSSEKILWQCANAANFGYDPTNALGAYLLFLRNSLTSRPDFVAKSAQKMWKATSETSQIAAKSAALELITLSAGEKAVGDVINALKSNNIQYRQAALKYSQNVSSPKMYGELMKFAQKERRAEVKAELVAAFGVRGDKDAWPFVQEYLMYNQDKFLSMAIPSAGALGGVDAIPAIVKVMNTSVPEVISVGKSTLLSLPGEEVVRVVAMAMAETSAEAKVAFLQILASRQAVTEAETVFAQTLSTDPLVRVAAYQALASVAAITDVSRISRLLNTAVDKEEVAALQRALFAALSEKSQEMQTDMVVDQAMNSNNPGAYGRVLAMIGGKNALDLVMEYGFNSHYADMKALAFDALLNWSDESALAQLYKIAASEPTGAFFDRALLAYISKTGSSKNSPEQKWLMLDHALEIAQTPEQKRAILRQIGRTGTFFGLFTAGKYLDDSSNDVQQAAVQAVRTIALAHPEYYGTEVTALLNKAIAVNKDPEADYQKEAILTHISTFPQEEGFIPIFNGIDMSGWQGNLTDYVPIDGAIVCDPSFGGKGNLYTENQYADFILRFDFQLTPAANNGIGIRAPLEGDAAYVGMEIQVLDNEDEMYQNLHEYQYHGSVYGVIPSKRGFLKPVGEWNSQEIVADGNHIKVTLNGTVILDGDISEASHNFTQTIDGYPHPGLSNTSGHIGFLGHGSWVAFRNIRIKDLSTP